nr:hypothetical protein [Janibacter sp. YB324]
MRVERVGLASTPSCLPVLACDFNDGQTGGVQRSDETGPVGTSPLNTNPCDIAVLVEERDDLRVAAAVCAELSVGDRSADEIEDCDVMRVLVRVDACDQPGRWR